MAAIIWTIITSLGLAYAIRNLFRARRVVGQIRKASGFTSDRKLAMYALAYVRVMHQSAIALAIFFNSAAGWLVMLTEPFPERGGISIALLVASATTLSLLSAIESGNDFE